MNRILPLLTVVFLLCAPGARAQSLGQVQYGDRVFSTGLRVQSIPWPDDAKEEMMSEERLGIALDCIRKTFGPIKEYREYYSECCGMHHFHVVLESEDELDFENGELCEFTLVSSRFPVAKEWFKGGLRVGRKPSQALNENILVKPRKDHPDWFDFWDDTERTDVISLYKLDADGTIVEIHVSFNEC